MSEDDMGLFLPPVVPGRQLSDDQAEVEAWIVNHKLDRATITSAHAMFYGMLSDMLPWEADCTQWYVGIAADLDARLYAKASAGHELKKGDILVTRECQSCRIAQLVEKIFTRICKCKGQDIAGDEYSRYVYAYIIRPHTRQ